MANKVMFVAGLGGFLQRFVEPLAIALRNEGYVTIGVAAAMASDGAAFNRTYSLPQFRRRGPLAALRALARLNHIVKSEQPQILHLHNPPAIGLGRLVAKRQGIPSIATISSTFLDSMSMRSVVFRASEFLFGGWSAITITSNSRDTAYYKRRAPAETVVQAPFGGMGIDIRSVLSARAHPSRLGGKPAIIVVGRLTQEKRLHLIADAFPDVRSVEPNASLTFLGSAQAGDSPWSVPKEPGISHIPWAEDPYPFIAAADVLVSASAREAFSMVIAEAILLGTPAVSTANRGVSDIALVAPGLVQITEPTPRGIARAILSAAQQSRPDLDEHLSQRWSQASAIAFHSAIIHRIAGEP
jgi:glycosyltransferase involved in cell wall biosynthesis